MLQEWPLSVLISAIEINLNGNLNLDYGNAILSGCPDITVELLQKVQNMAARIIPNKNPRDSATHCPKSLHLLPVQYSIDYKVATLVFKKYS